MEENELLHYAEIVRDDLRVKEYMFMTARVGTDSEALVALLDRQFGWLPVERQIIIANNGQILVGEDNKDLAETLNTLADFYQGTGNNKKAEPLYVEALEMKRRLYKSDHQQLVTSIVSMAIFYISTGDYKKVEPLYVEALEMSRRLYKSDHHELATVLNNLGSFYSIIGESQDGYVFL